MDLALSMVEEDHGRDLALLVARYMVVFLKRPGGQSQFSAHLAAQMSGKTPIQQAQAYVLQNLAAPLTVDALASQAGMSTRNFARVFRTEMNMTPADFVGAARLDARRLLGDTDLALQRIAAQTGFGDVNTMRRTFVRHLGLTPADYRRRFLTASAERTRRPALPRGALDA